MKQHPLCSDCEDKITPMDLPIPGGLKKEWAACESRRQFLGRSGKVLGWAALASLFGDVSLHYRAFASGPKREAASLGNSLGLSHFALPRRWTFLITSRTLQRNSTTTCPPQFEEISS
jgi:hypothetical protein